METRAVEQDWGLIVSMLPGDLESSAREAGALRRRRGVQRAEDLLRLAMAYGYCGLSLRATAGWAAQRGIARCSDVAVLKRLRGAATWIGRLLAAKLAERWVDFPQEAGAGLRVRLVDATSLSIPGSRGTDWRVHLGFDLATGCIDAAELTSASGGETLTRHQVPEGVIAIADRGYAHRKGIASVAQSGGKLIVRLNTNTVPLEQSDGQSWDWLEPARDLAPGQAAEFAVRTAPDPSRSLPAVAGRLVVARKSEAATEEARRKLRRSAQRNGRTPDARALAVAAYVVLFTNLALEQLGTSEVLSLYRFRWQVELAFKRLKGIVALDEIAAKDPQLCRTLLLTKLLAMLILEELANGFAVFSPWGYGRPKTHLPLASDPELGRDPAASRGSHAVAGGVAAPHDPLAPRDARHATQAPEPKRARHLSTSSLSHALSLS